MQTCYRMTKHAHERSTARSIPPGIAQMILDYGISREAGDGARKFALSGESLSALRRDFGRDFPKVVESYRRRGAYVVVVADKIITVAFADRPIFN
ncbi:hypothetical protein [Sinisalibacter lacisalsi]|uniref:DUF4258 domain-containing protein n=1 Tax=Sinisalibacter lacisalsi TaxID=1526570 RepID=A0ABQ1QAE2_9RHOB|nr:hypothetical protein [Sinisalibacter lacisalsi]GGD19478.1 hypothetical protein GCM10011358_00080 [Sinisalibacter lacisalsi]